MAVRRFNYTGRIRLHRKHMKFYIYSYPDEKIYFDANLDLTEYELPADSRVVVEVYRQNTNRRFVLGSTNEQILTTDKDISDFYTPEGIKFRVKVISEDKPGLILAQADRIEARAEHQDQTATSSLLKVRQSKDLRQEVFKLNIGTEPELLINADIGNWRELILSKKFVCLVFPSILRQILVHILLILNYFDTDSDEWSAQWLNYAQHLVNTKPPEHDDDIETIQSWIDQVVSAFSRKFRMAKEYKRVAKEFYG